MVAFATQVKRRRGTTAQNDAFTGAEGEIVVDTEKHTLRVHDGETLGGFEMARQTDLNDKATTSYVNSQLGLKADTDLGNIPTNYDYVVESQEPTADNGYTWYRKYKSGWVEQGGYGPGTLLKKVFIQTLPVPMANARYYFNVFAALVSSDTGNYFVRGIEPVTTRIQYYMFLNGTITTNNPVVIWKVCGMAA